MDSHLPFSVLDEALSKLRYFFSNEDIYHQLSDDDCRIVSSCYVLLSLVVEHGNL